MKKAGIIIGSILVIAGIVIGIVLATKGPSNETAYREAVAALAAGSIDEATEGFRALPENYAISDFNPTAAEWLAAIESEYACDFVGTWRSDAMSFEVMREVDSFGIRFKYRKAVGGQIAEGYLVKDAKDPAFATLQSDASEVYPDSMAGVSRLHLVDDGTLQLYVNGALQQTFRK